MRAMLRLTGRLESLLHPLNQQGEMFSQMDTNIDNHGERERQFSVLVPIGSEKID